MKPNKAEQEYMQRVRDNGCVVCGVLPAAAHHIRAGQGIGLKASNYLVVGLCFEHHQGSLSIHSSKKQFEALFGDELSLLAKTIKGLNR